GLRTNVFLYNSGGIDPTLLLPYVQYNGPLNAGQTVAFMLEFYVPDRQPFTNSLIAKAVLPATTGTNAAAGVPINRCFLDLRDANSPRFVIEFTTIPGRTYTILYSDDL